MTRDWQDIRQQAQNDLLAYMALTKPESKFGKQHYLFRDIVQDLASRRKRFICISCPPRHSKSWTFSQALPAWWLGNKPTDQVIATSYAASLAQNFGASVRADMSSDLYESIFSKDSQPSGMSSSGSDFKTNAGGKYKATGVSGSLTGFGGDLIIVDDPTKNASTADSPRYKAMLEKFFSETLYTRLMPNGVIVVMQTRWREDDLTGYILKNFPDWEYINVPAITETQDVGTYGALGRAEGQALWPAFFTEADLGRTRKILGESSFQALYQGRPVSAKGGTLAAANVCWASSEEDVKRNAEQLVDYPVYSLWSWDTALTKKLSADYTVGQHWVVFSSGKVWLKDYIRMRGSFTDVQDKITECYSSSAAYAGDLGIAQLCLVEHSHMGLNLKDQLAKDSPEVRTELWLPGKYGNKLDRLQATLPDWRALKVYLTRFDTSKARYSDFDDCLEELLKAGYTSHDDFMDAATQAILRARTLTASANEVVQAGVQRQLPGKLQASTRQTLVGTTRSQRVTSKRWV